MLSFYRDFLGPPIVCFGPSPKHQAFGLIRHSESGQDLGFFIICQFTLVS